MIELASYPGLLTQLFSQPWKKALFSTAAKKAVWEGPGMRLYTIEPPRIKDIRLLAGLQLHADCICIMQSLTSVVADKSGCNYLMTY